MGISTIERKAFFFDRDGVINKAKLIQNKPHPPSSIEELELTSGIERLINFLVLKNYLIIVITNQPDIARGTKKKSEDKKINDYLMSKLKINKIYVCYHDNVDNCNCRKPKIGNIIAAKNFYNINMEKSFFIGDRRSDILAGNKSGCKSIFIDYNYDEEKPVNYFLHAMTINDVHKKLLGVLDNEY
jgi:D-glycero-D-manno-heptose 1,7-bisphosphate phosphatase